MKITWLGIVMLVEVKSWFGTNKSNLSQRQWMTVRRASTNQRQFVDWWWELLHLLQLHNLQPLVKTRCLHLWTGHKHAADGKRNNENCLFVKIESCYQLLCSWACTFISCVDERGSTYNSAPAPPSIELNGKYFAQATTTMMIKIKSSESTHRSVRFAETTSQPMVLPNINCGWYSRADKSRFSNERRCNMQGGWDQFWHRAALLTCPRTTWSNAQVSNLSFYFLVAIWLAYEWWRPPTLMSF